MREGGREGGREREGKGRREREGGREGRKEGGREGERGGGSRGGSRIFLRGGQKAIEYARSNVRGCRAQRAQRAVARGVWGHGPKNWNRFTHGDCRLAARPPEDRDRFIVHHVYVPDARLSYTRTWPCLITRTWPSTWPWPAGARRPYVLRIQGLGCVRTCEKG